MAAALPRAFARLLKQRFSLGFRRRHRTLRLFCDPNNKAIIISTMSRVKLQRQPPARDLHEQVAAQIRRAIAEGEAGPGERLPPAGDLAAELGVNRNTVLRALRLLRDEGLLEFRRGRGVTVSGSPHDGALVTRAREFVEFAGRLGYRVDEMVEVIDRVARSAAAQSR